MNQYDAEYYLIEPNEELKNRPRLYPDIDTDNRNYTYEPMAQGSAPLIFSNSYKDKFSERGYEIMNELPIVLFDGSYFGIATSIWKELNKLKIPNMYTHPMVYIHDDDKWYENYWFCGFAKEGFDCWDRDNSEHSPPRRTSGKVAFTKISLSSKALDEVSLEDRLLFKLGRSADGVKLCHQSIKHLFESEGTELVRVDEW